MTLSADITFNGNLIENEICTITYSGFLFKNNSDSVTIVYGFDNEWNNTSEQQMLKTENGFIAQIKILNFNNLNFCFKNSNNEWDNNNNFNYTSPISKQKIEENFIINENIIDHLLDNILDYDLSNLKENQELLSEYNNIQKPIINDAEQDIVQETVSNDTQQDTIQETVSNDTQQDVVQETVLNDAEQDIIQETVLNELDKNFNMDLLIDEVLTPLKAEEISPLPNEILLNKEDHITEDIDFSDKPSDLEEDEKVDNLITNLISNLYERATPTEVPKINIVDNITKPTLIEKENLEEKTKINENETIENTIDSIYESIEDSLFGEMISNTNSNTKIPEQTSLIEINNSDNFIVSARSLSKFYILRKKIKLAFYKIASLPKKLLNFDE